MRYNSPLKMEKEIPKKNLAPLMALFS